MSTPLNNSPIKIDHDRFQKELKNLSKSDGFLNGYLVVKKDDQGNDFLERMNGLEHFFRENILGESTTPSNSELENAIVSYLKIHKDDFETVREIKLVRKLANRLGLTEDKKTQVEEKNNIQDLIRDIFKNVTLKLRPKPPKVENSETSKNFSIQTDEPPHIEKLRGEHLPVPKEHVIENSNTQTKKTEEEQEKHALSQDGEKASEEEAHSQAKREELTEKENQSQAQMQQHNITQQPEPIAEEKNKIESIVPDVSQIEIPTTSNKTKHESSQKFEKSLEELKIQVKSFASKQLSEAEKSSLADAAKRALFKDIFGYSYSEETAKHQEQIIYEIIEAAERADFDSINGYFLNSISSPLEQLEIFYKVSEFNQILNKIFTGREDRAQFREFNIKMLNLMLNIKKAASYEKIVRSVYSETKASSYERGINQIIEAAAKNDTDEMDNWLQKHIIHPSNQLAILNAIQELKIGEERTATYCKNRINNLKEKNTNEIDLSNPAWDPLREPLGILYNRFRKTMGEHYHDDTADDLDKLIYDFFFYIQDGDIEGLKKSLTYIKHDDLRNQEILLKNSLVLIDNLIQEVSKPMSTESKEYINVLATIQKNINKELEIPAYTSKIEIPESRTFYSKDKANYIKEIFKREEATEERTRAVFKMGFAITSILGTFTIPMFKHLDATDILTPSLAPTIEPPPQGVDLNVRQAISDQPHWTAGSQTPAINLNDASLAISDQPHWTPLPLETTNFNETPETTNFNETPVVYRDVVPSNYTNTSSFSNISETLIEQNPYFPSETAWKFNEMTPPPMPNHDWNPISLSANTDSLPTNTTTMGSLALTAAIGVVGAAKFIFNKLFGGLPYTPQFRADLQNAIVLALSGTDKVVEGENEFIRLAKQNLNGAFQILEDMHKESALSEEGILILTSQKFYESFSSIEDQKFISQRMSTPPFYNIIQMHYRKSNVPETGVAFGVKSKTEPNAVHADSATVPATVVPAAPASAKIEKPKPLENALQSAKKSIDEAIQNETLNTELDRIIKLSNLSPQNLNDYKELLEYAIDKTANNKEASQTLLDFIEKLINSEQSLGMFLGSPLLEKFAGIHAHDMSMANQLLDYASKIPKSDVGNYLALSIAKIVAEKVNTETLQKIISAKKGNEIILVLQGAALAKYGISQINDLIKTLKQNPNLPKDFMPFAEVCAKYNPGLLRELSKFNTSEIKRTEILKYTFGLVTDNPLIKKTSPETFNPPFSANLLSAISNAFSKETEKAESGENIFINLAQQDLNGTFQILETLQKQAGIDVEDINYLISAKLLQSLRSTDQIALIQSRLNGSTTFNKIFSNVISNRCSEEMNIALNRLRNLNKNSNPLDVQTAWDKAWTSSDYLKLGKADYLGIQFYTRLSSNLVLNQLERRMVFNDQGVLITPADDPLMHLHQKVCEEKFENTTLDDVFTYIQKIPDSQSEEETQIVLRSLFVKKLLNSDSNRLIALKEIYFKQMAQGDTRTANLAEKEFKQILQQIDHSQYPAIARSSVDLGGIKGTNLVESLFFKIVENEPDLAMEILEEYCKSKNPSPKSLLLMIRKLNNLNEMDKELVALAVGFAIQTILKNGVRIDYIKPLVEWMIENSPRKARELIEEDLKFSNPKFKDYIESFVKDLALKDSTDAMIHLSSLLFNHEDTIIKAAGSALFHVLITKKELSLPKIYPKVPLHDIRKFLAKVIQSDSEEFDNMKLIAQQIVDEHPDLNVVVEEVKPILSEEEKRMLSLPKADLESYSHDFDPEAVDYLVGNQPILVNPEALETSNYLKDISKITSNIRTLYHSTNKNQQEQALQEIKNLLNDNSLRVKHIGKNLLLEMSKNTQHNFEFDKKILSTSCELPESFEALKLEVASNIAENYKDDLPSLEAFFKEDKAITELFFKGLACVSSNESNYITIFLKGLNGKQINVVPIFKILKSNIPETLTQISQEWKQKSGLNRLGELAEKTKPSTLILPFQPSFEDKLINLFELNLTKKEITSEVKQELTNLVLEDPIKFFALLDHLTKEVKSADATLVATTFISEALLHLNNQSVLQIISLKISQSSFIGTLTYQILKEKMENAVDRALTIIKDSRIRAGDEQSKIRKYQSLSVEPLKQYANNFSFELLAIMDQKLQNEDPLSSNYLREGVCTALMGILGEKAIFSLLRLRQFDPDSASYPTLKTFEEIILEKHPEWFPVFAIKYLNEMGKASSKNAAIAKKELDNLLLRRSFKPYIFNIADAAVSILDPQNISLEILKFIEKLLQNFIESKQPILALEILKNYAALYPEPLTVQQFVDQICQLNISEAQKDEIAETLIKNISQYKAQGVKEDFLLPLMKWLIENAQEKAFLFILTDLTNLNPVFQTNLPDVLKSLTNSNHQFTELLFRTVIAHQNPLIRAAGATLAQIATLEYQDPSIPLFLFDKASKGVFSKTFENHEKLQNEHSEEIKVLTIAFEILMSQIQELQNAISSIPENTVDILVGYQEDIDARKNQRLLSQESLLETMVLGLNTQSIINEIKKLDREVEELENEQEPYKLSSGEIKYINLKEYYELIEGFNQKKDLCQGYLNQIKFLQSEINKIQNTQGLLIELSKNLKKDIDFPKKSKTKIKSFQEDAEDITIEVPEAFSRDVYSTFETKLKSLNPSDPIVHTELNMVFEKILTKSKENINFIEFLASVHYFNPPQTPEENLLRGQQISDLLLGCPLEKLEEIIGRSETLLILNTLLEIGMLEMSKTSGFKGIKLQTYITSIGAKLAERGQSAIGQSPLTFSSLTLMNFISSKEEELSKNIQFKSTNSTMEEFNQKLGSLASHLKTNENIKQALISANDISDPIVKNYVVSQLINSLNSLDQGKPKFPEPQKVLNLFSEKSKLALGVKFDELMNFWEQHSGQATTIQTLRELRTQRPKITAKRKPLTNINPNLPLNLLDIPTTFDSSSLSKLNEQIKAYMNSLSRPQEEKNIEIQKIINDLIMKIGESPEVLSIIASYSKEYGKVGQKLNELEPSKLSEITKKFLSNESVVSFLKECSKIMDTDKRKAILDVAEVPIHSLTETPIKQIQFYTNLNKLNPALISAMCTQTNEIVKTLVNKTSETLNEGMKQLLSLQGSFKNERAEEDWANQMVNSIVEYDNPNTSMVTYLEDSVKAKLVSLLNYVLFKSKNDPTKWRAKSLQEKLSPVLTKTKFTKKESLDDLKLTGVPKVSVEMAELQAIAPQKTKKALSIQSDLIPERQTTNLATKEPLSPEIIPKTIEHPEYYSAFKSTEARSAWTGRETIDSSIKPSTEPELTQKESLDTPKLPESKVSVEVTELQAIAPAQTAIPLPIESKLTPEPQAIKLAANEPLSPKYDNTAIPENVVFKTPEQAFKDTKSEDAGAGRVTTDSSIKSSPESLLTKEEKEFSQLWNNNFSKIFSARPAEVAEKLNSALKFFSILKRENVKKIWVVLLFNFLKENNLNELLKFQNKELIDNLTNLFKIASTIEHTKEMASKLILQLPKNIT
jgi:hypothetical protein